MRTVPLGGKKAAGRVALIDDEDWELVSACNWYVREYIRGGGQFPLGPYAITNVNRGGQRKTVFMHNLIMGRIGVDHANGNGLDNQRGNLRPATNGENMRNRRVSAVRSSSPYKGVSWYPSRSKWLARITLDKRRRFLGYFTDEVEAARAYDAAAREMFGEFARPNFPLAD